MIQLFDPRACTLGEGPLWHPLRKQLFWFDIPNQSLLTQTQDGPLYWRFEEQVSAAGWVNEETLLIASETALSCFDLTSGELDQVVALEADNSLTRSNDGRADPWGGFWIGTMGKHAEAQAGTIWRFYAGELRQIAPDITVSNAICFAPDRTFAYYTDTPTQKVLRVPLHPDNGWPDGPPEVFLDLTARDLNPDGAVTDAQGNLWIACWDAARLTCYAADARFLRDVEIPALRPTCPAFGGPDMTDLFVTSARIGLSEDQMGQFPHSGQTFVIGSAGTGTAEPRVIL